MNVNGEWGRWFRSNLCIFLNIRQLLRNSQPIHSRSCDTKKPGHIRTRISHLFYSYLTEYFAAFHCSLFF
jgi:hypothetical protein